MAFAAAWPTERVCNKEKQDRAPAWLLHVIAMCIRHAQHELPGILLRARSAGHEVLRPFSLFSSHSTCRNVLLRPRNTYFPNFVGMYVFGVSCASGTL